MRKGKSRLHRTWEDEYFDGRLDPTCEGWCEDTQEIVKVKNDGWDDIDEAIREYWEDEI